MILSYINAYSLQLLWPPKSSTTFPKLGIGRIFFSRMFITKRTSIYLIFRLIGSRFGRTCYVNSCDNFSISIQTYQDRKYRLYFKQNWTQSHYMRAIREFPKIASPEFMAFVHKSISQRNTMDTNTMTKLRFEHRNFAWEEMFIILHYASH